MKLINALQKLYTEKVRQMLPLRKLILCGNFRKITKKAEIKNVLKYQTSKLECS